MELRIAEQYVEALEEGKKTTTIRAGMRGATPGEPIRFSAGRSDWFISGEITQVAYKRARDLTDADARKDGFKNKDELKVALKDFYPDLGPGTPVTVITFDLSEPR